MPYNVLPTVFGHCTPRFGGKRRLPRPHSCAPPLLVTIKGGGRPPLRGTFWTLAIITYVRDHCRSLSATEHPTNFASSRDLGASLPLSLRLYPLLQALRVQDNTVSSYTLLLDVRPRGRNQDKSVRYYVASCINIWDEETCNIITSWVRAAGSGHRHND